MEADRTDDVGQLVARLGPALNGIPAGERPNDNALGIGGPLRLDPCRREDVEEVRIEITVRAQRYRHIVHRTTLVPAPAQRGHDAVFPHEALPDQAACTDLRFLHAEGEINLVEIYALVDPLGSDSVVVAKRLGTAEARWRRPGIIDDRPGLVDRSATVVAHVSAVLYARARNVGQVRRRMPGFRRYDLVAISDTVSILSEGVFPELKIGRKIVATHPLAPAFALSQIELIGQRGPGIVIQLGATKCLHFRAAEIRAQKVGIRSSVQEFLVDVELDHRGRTIGRSNEGAAGGGDVLAQDAGLKGELVLTSLDQPLLELHLIDVRLLLDEVGRSKIHLFPIVDGLVGHPRLLEERRKRYSINAAASLIGRSDLLVTKLCIGTTRTRGRGRAADRITSNRAIRIHEHARAIPESSAAIEHAPRKPSGLLRCRHRGVGGAIEQPPAAGIVLKRGVPDRTAIGPPLGDRVARGSGIRATRKIVI